MRKAEERARETYPIEDCYDEMATGKRIGFIEGYEQAIKDMKETFEEMSKNTNIVIDAVKVLGSLLDNPDIREKLGKSKPIPKKPIKTNPFFGGEKK